MGSDLPGGFILMKLVFLGNPSGQISHYAHTGEIV